MKVRFHAYTLILEQNERGRRKLNQVRSKDVGYDTEHGLAIEAGLKVWLEYICQQSGNPIAGKTKFDSDSSLIDAIVLEEKLLKDFASRWNAGAFFGRVSDNANASDITKGSEHYVIRYTDESGGRRVLKATLPGKYGRYEYSPSIYLNSLCLVQSLVAALDIRMHGVMQMPNGPSIVTSMQYIPGRHPRPTEIASYLKKMGWVEFHDGSQTLDFINEELHQIIRDGHANNWVCQKESGVMVPIDISIETAPGSVNR